MGRDILLIEPKYKNKYPPIGLMKLATYHKLLGDNVKFFKGDIKDLVIEKLAENCIEQLMKIDGQFNWQQSEHFIRQFIRTKQAKFLENLPITDSRFEILLKNCILSYADIFRKKRFSQYPKWDRIYVTTLFTFYWKVTIEAIHEVKNLARDVNDIMVGGVLASLLHNELESETGIKAHEGLLDKPGMLDPENQIAASLIVDDLPLDYSILDEIDYEYPTGSAYFTFMTKGCTRKCAFCSVPILEPSYKPKVETIDKFFAVKEKFGEQQHLLLMDNNVLASPLFPEIIQEIKDMGFVKGATFIEPNQLDIAIKNLENGVNDKAYLRKSYKLLHNMLRKLKGQVQQNFYNVLDENNLLKLESTTKEGILNSYLNVKAVFEKYRSKSPRQRFVDFNQGTDARYVTDELMRLMSEIPIRPLRIAFDYWGMKDKYEKAVRLAAKYNISELSNYILYNFKDTPDELYRRLEINVLLSEELNIHIYSFPMKYIPLFGEEAKNRDFIGTKWNRKYIRAIQSILNVTKGIVAPGRNFFEKAFGKNIEEFRELLLMPETYIVYRYFFESMGLTDEWRVLYRSLNEEEKQLAITIIKANDFKELPVNLFTKGLHDLFRHYTIKREDVKVLQDKDIDYKKVKIEFDKLIKSDPFKDLTLTYDFEKETINKYSLKI